MMSTYPKTHAKVKNWIFNVQFPGNWFGSGIIWNDFWSSIIWDNQIQVSFAGFKNHKNPGIQPTYELLFMFCTHWLLIILICCFGILRQDSEQSSNTVLVITSLSAWSVLWFNFNPNRRRRRRASMQDDNRLRITAMMRLTISMFELRGLWFLDDLLRSL